MIYKTIFTMCCITAGIVYCSDTVTIPTRITIPSNSTVRLGEVMFAGTAQNPSRIVILIDGVHAGEITTNSNGSDSWSRSIFITAVGAHTAQALSYYDGAIIPIASKPVSFTVAGPLLALSMQHNTSKSTVRHNSALNYSVTITNNSVIDATDVILTATLSEGLQHIFGHLSNGGTVTVNDNVITAHVGTLSIGQSVTLAVQTFVAAVQNSFVSNTVVVNSSNALMGQLTNNLQVT